MRVPVPDGFGLHESGKCADGQTQNHWPEQFQYVSAVFERGMFGHFSFVGRIDTNWNRYECLSSFAGSCV